MQTLVYGPHPETSGMETKWIVEDQNGDPDQQKKISPSAVVSGAAVLWGSAVWLW